MVEEFYKRLIVYSQSLQQFWSDFFYILIQYEYESNHKSKISFTWKVNLKEDVFIDGGESTCENFNIVEDFDLHTLFEVIDEENLSMKVLT